MSRQPYSRLVAAAAILSAAAFAASCTASLGPGYAIDKQEIRVDFLASADPRIRINAVYQLRNNGNQPLTSLELRLPGRRRFHFNQPAALWDSDSLPLQTSPFRARNVLLSFARPWSVSETHTLHLSVEYQLPAAGENSLSFSPDAFFLPAQGWSPELLPARGILATGGVPPKKWTLVATLPPDFLVHISGEKPHISHDHSAQVLTAVQRASDGYPFVIAARFAAAKFTAGASTVNLWTRSAPDPSSLRHPGDTLLQAIRAYDSIFGTRNEKKSQSLWIVECPVVSGCFSNAASSYSPWTSGDAHATSAEMASLDTIMVDISSGVPQLAAAVAPSLASSWLGYDQNPGFFDQDPPLSALPAFAAATGREAVLGRQLRSEVIRRALAAVPVSSQPVAPDSDDVIRAKSLLFFYALQDRYGQDAFSAALRHMLYARRGGGFDIHDLIAAFEEQTHQNAAEFVRLWMKHPGVPADFRQRYESSAAQLSIPKEPLP